MPIGFLTDADRDRLNRFPPDIAPGDLLGSFTLSDADLELVQVHRGDHNRLGCALQLVALRFMGFAPDDLTTAPARAVAYLALQLGVPATALAQYGDREHTRTDHLREIQAQLGFRDARPTDFEVLGDWLLARALEHDRPIALFHLACEWLRREKIVRPGVTRLERIVATARERAQTLAQHPLQQSYPASAHNQLHFVLGEPALQQALRNLRNPVVILQTGEEIRVICLR